MHVPIGRFGLCVSLHMSVVGSRARLHRGVAVKQSEVDHDRNQSPLIRRSWIRRDMIGTCIRWSSRRSNDRTDWDNRARKDRNDRQGCRVSSDQNFNINPTDIVLKWVGYSIL